MRKNLLKGLTMNDEHSVELILSELPSNVKKTITPELLQETHVLPTVPVDKMITEKTFDEIEISFIHQLRSAQMKATAGTLTTAETGFLKMTLELLKARKHEYKDKTKSFFTPEDYGNVLKEMSQ